MAQITNKRLGELIQALFRILEKYPDGMKGGAGCYRHAYRI